MTTATKAPIFVGTYRKGSSWFLVSVSGTESVAARNLRLFAPKEADEMAVKQAELKPWSAGDPFWLQDRLAWVPHEDATWPVRVLTLKKDVEMKETGCHMMKNGNVEWVVTPAHTAKAGQKVKIVMSSRFGDIGITSNLEAENGYGARIHRNDFFEYFEPPTGDTNPS